VSFFSFIILFLISLFFILQNGLYLDNLHISNFSLKNSYIRVDNQLHITIDLLKIKQKKRSTKKSSFQELNNYIQLINNIIPYIGSITIEKIEFNGVEANFDYSSKENGLLHFHTNNIDCTSFITSQNGNLAFHIQNLDNKKYKTKIDGDIFINSATSTQYIKLNILLNNDANLTLYGLSNSNHLQYSLKSHNDIHHIKTILNLIPFDKNIKYWANDAIKAKSLTLKKLYGEIRFNNLKDAYKEIYCNAVVHTLQYRYNPKLAPIDSKQTKLEFKNGVLSIRPQQAYSYNTYLKNSWLKIDFTKKDPLLDLYLHLDGQLNSAILHLLSIYKIVLPLKQKSGLTKTDLHLTIDLQTIDVTVDGDFLVKKSIIAYKGIDFTLLQSHMHLHNKKLLIDKMQIKYQNILDTNLTANYNIRKNLGDIHFCVNNIQYDGLKFDNKNSKLSLLYHLSKEKNFLEISQSQWEYKNQKIVVNAFSMPYSIHDTTFIISSPVLVNIKNFAQAFVSGSIDVKNKNLNFDIDIFKMLNKNLKLKQKHISLKATYNAIFRLKSMNDITLSINNLLYKIKKFQIIAKNKTLFVRDSSIQIGNFLKSKITLTHSFNSKHTAITLNDFLLKSPNIKAILYKNKKIKLQLFLEDRNITLKSPQINSSFFLDKTGWNLKLSSLNKIAQDSAILKELNISNGSINFSQKKNQTITKFHADILSPYSILMHKKSEIHRYNIAGAITKDKNISLHINNNIQIKTDNQVKISSKNAMINIHALIKLIKTIQKIEPKEKSSSSIPTIYFHAIDSSLYIGKKRYLLSDTMEMQYINGVMTAQLLYKKGHASFLLNKNQFYLYGKDFNDKFMQHLLSISKFKGGALAFSIHGTFNNYAGLFFIKKTTMLDYKLLNNILAFVNTIPSLVTFSLPNYNKDGLYVKNAYLKFSSKKGLMNIENFYLNSKELKIIGKGTADIGKNRINLLLNLKTDLASNISKIPLVGYLIFDGKSLSTTLKITGKLNNPKIQTQIVQDIVAAPLNIIQRTLTLPYKLIKNAVGDMNSSTH